ncbi:MAG: type II secretion system protein GspL [Gammaproteobacteria bacterium]
MRERLFIRLGQTPTDIVSWVRVGNDSEEEALQADSGKLDDAILAASGCRVVVLVPSVDVILSSAIIPTRNRQRILSAIPFALEDQFACEVDELHFAIGKRESDGTVNTAVVSREKMDQWLEAIRGAGIEPDTIVPDCLAVPMSEDGWTVFIDETVSIIRTGGQHGISVDNDNLQDTLSLMLSEVEDVQPESISIIDCRESDQPLPIDMNSLDVESRCEKSSVAAITWFAHAFKDSDIINLAQGPYSRQEQLGKLLRPWRAAAAMLLALVGISLIATSLDYFRLKDESTRLSQQIDKLYLDSCPGASRIVNVKVQMERCLKKMGGGATILSGGFLDMLADAGASLNKTDNMELTRLSYREGMLDLALMINDLQGLDKLKQRLSTDAKLSVEIQSASARDNKVEARLQITGSDS